MCDNNEKKLIPGYLLSIVQKLIPPKDHISESVIMFTQIKGTSLTVN